jgi:regulator of replication initiation timing
MDSSHQSSSRSGNDYSSTLIGTVSELRMELQRTMAEIQSVKDQNRSLITNNQAIRDELLDTRKNYSEAYENYMATVTEKLDAERQNEAFMDRLKKQLLEKTKEFPSGYRYNSDKSPRRVGDPSSRKNDQGAK